MLQLILKEIVKQLKQKAFIAFSQNKAPNNIFGAVPGALHLRILDEMHALGDLVLM